VRDPRVRHSGSPHETQPHPRAPLRAIAPRYLWPCPLRRGNSADQSVYIPSSQPLPTNDTCVHGRLLPTSGPVAARDCPPSPPPTSPSFLCWALGWVALLSRYRISSADFLAYVTAVPSWNGSLVLGLNFRDPSNPVGRALLMSLHRPWRVCMRACLCACVCVRVCAHVCTCVRVCCV
jgi:hypothetical protein